MSEKKEVKTCRTCAHATPAPANVQSNAIGQWLGECHCNPPAVVAVPVQSPMGRNIVMQVTFPMVNSTCFCSQHKEASNAVAGN